jgi:alkylation response protein AidB-like acyl-CoA dehydrogenase
LDFRDSPEEAAFRDRLRAWLTEQKGKFPTSGDEYWAQQGEWHQALYAAGFFGTSWPKEYGGQDLPPVYDVIVDEEIAKAGAPARPSLGYLVVGLGHHGSKELQQRFLPGMINGSERWCQGFSEPGAGSDLASLTTTATREGDEYVIHGAQDLDELLRCGRLVSVAGAHRQRRTQASRYLGVHRVDAPARHRAATT